MYVYVYLLFGSTTVFLLYLIELQLLIGVSILWQFCAIHSFFNIIMEYTWIGGKGDCDLRYQVNATEESIKSTFRNGKYIQTAVISAFFSAYRVLGFGYSDQK